MSPVGVVGVGLSALALLVTLGVAVDAVRRKDLRVAGRPVRGTAAAAARGGLVLLTLSAFAAGTFGVPLLATARPWGGADRGGAVTATATERTVRLPFYVQSVVERRDARGAVLGGTTRRVLQIPWVLLLWLGLYRLGLARGTPAAPAPSGRIGSGDPAGGGRPRGG